MDDSSADLWLLALLLLGTYGFVPIAILTAASVVWYVKTRSTWARNALVLAGCLFCVSGFGFAKYTLPLLIEQHAYEVRDAADTHVLTAPTRFRGNVLPAGSTLHFDEHESAYRVELHGPATIAGVSVTGPVDVSPKGIDGEVTLTRNATIAGLPCMATTARFEGGALLECDLSATASIHGVACSGHLLFNGPARTDFACTLARPYRTHGVTFFAGSKISFGTVIVGPKAPSLRLLGHALRPGTEVRVRPPYFEIQFVGTSPLSYGGCPLRHVDLERAPYAGYSLQKSGWCNAALPREALRL